MYVSQTVVNMSDVCFFTCWVCVCSVYERNGNDYVQKWRLLVKNIEQSPGPGNAGFLYILKLESSSNLRMVLHFPPRRCLVFYHHNAAGRRRCEIYFLVWRKTTMKWRKISKRNVQYRLCVFIVRFCRQNYVGWISHLSGVHKTFISLDRIMHAENAWMNNLWKCWGITAIY